MSTKKTSSGPSAADKKRMAAERKAHNAALKAKKSGTVKKAAAPKKAAVSKKEKAPREQMPESNGIRQPKPQTQTGKLWAILDKLFEQLGRHPAFSEFSAKVPEGMNIHTVKTQYAAWKKFCGVSGRLKAE